jgi:hypothetical protein
VVAEVWVVAIVVVVASSVGEELVVVEAVVD